VFPVFFAIFPEPLFLSSDDIDEDKPFSCKAFPRDGRLTTAVPPPEVLPLPLPLYLLAPFIQSSPTTLCTSSDMTEELSSSDE